MEDPQLAWEGVFLIDLRVVECVLPERIWDAVGFTPIGERETAIPNSEKRKMQFATGVVELMGDIAGTSVFRGDNDIEPVLGRTILLSLGIEFEDNGTLTKLPAIKMPGIRPATGQSPT